MICEIDNFSTKGAQLLMGCIVLARQKDIMFSKTSCVMTEEKETRGGDGGGGCCGCFGWVFKIFKGRKGGRRLKHQKGELSLSSVNHDPKLLENDEDSRKEEHEDQSSCLLDNGSIPCEASAGTTGRMTACQRRRARRRALAAARKAAVKEEEECCSSTEKEEATTKSEVRPRSAETLPTTGSSDGPPLVTEAHRGTRRTRRRRNRRKASASKIKSEDRLAATRTEAPPPPVWPSPSVRVFGRDGRPFVTTWEDAAYGAFHAQRNRY